MRLKALGAGLNRVEDYRRDQLVSDVDLLPSGYLEFETEFWKLVSDVDSWNEGQKLIIAFLRPYFLAKFMLISM